MAFTYEDAAHLLRRMGFGGNPDEISDLESRGKEGAVDYLINHQNINNQPLDDLLAASFNFTDPRENNFFNQGEIRRWWFTRMVHTRRQFEEKMTLFWHNHFATALSQVQDIYMYIQNLKLRQYALSKFDDLVETVSKDAAMLIWLNGLQNVAGSPNENFARELQELFTMGIFDPVTGQANYTEDDVKEVARAFTGWKFRNNRRDGDPYNVEWFVQANQHDNGNKTIFAGTPYQVSGNLSGEDVIDVICNRPQTGRFLTKKLFDFFVYPLTSSSEDKETMDKFAAVYASSNHSIKEMVRAIFTSSEFFSERARYGLVKQPVEYIVGAIRMLGADYRPGANITGERNPTSNILAAFSRNMTQDIFNPPDVAGWDLNLGWTNTATMLERFNFANALVTNRNHTNPGVSVTNDQLSKYTKSKSKKTVNKFLEVMNLFGVPKTVKTNLRNYLETNDQGVKVGFTKDEQTIDKKVRGLVHQIMCLPEFELN
ncbi:MAG: DUF1800 domain-containing protein [Acidobacteriota bacterium]